VRGGAGSRNRGESGRQAPPESSQEVSEEAGRAGGLDEGGVGAAGAGREVSPWGSIKEEAQSVWRAKRGRPDQSERDGWGVAAGAGAAEERDCNDGRTAGG